MFSECKEESLRKFLMSFGTGAGTGITFFGTGGVKKVTRSPLTSGHGRPSPALACVGATWPTLSVN